MIIYGTRGVTSTVSSGQFFCPSCNTERPYRERRVKQFVHIYWIPLIPVKTAGEFIECGVCKGSFKQAVLHYRPEPPSETFAKNFQNAVRQVIVCVAVADGAVNPTSVQALKDAYYEFAGVMLSTQEIEQEASQLNGRTDVKRLLSGVGNQVNNRGKAALVKAAYSVAVSDGALSDNEKKQLADLAGALNIPSDKFRDLVRSVGGGQQQQQPGQA